MTSLKERDKVVFTVYTVPHTVLTGGYVQNIYCMLRGCITEFPERGAHKRESVQRQTCIMEEYFVHNINFYTLKQHSI